MSKHFLAQLMMIFFVVSYYSMQCSNKNNMSTNFCNYLKTDNREGLKKEVNSFLATIKPGDGQELNFKKIKDWISSHDCVTSVIIQPGEIRTYPPIKEFTVDLKDNGGGFSKTISISFSDKKYEINVR